MPRPAFSRLFRTARAPLLLAAAAAALGGCVSDGYGYGGLAVGEGYYGEPGAYGGPGYYGNPYEYGYGYGGDYGYPGYGWYDGYYYPGYGVYVFDRGGHRYGWRDRDRAYWQGGRGGNSGQQAGAAQRNRGYVPGVGRDPNYAGRSGAGYRGDAGAQRSQSLQSAPAASDRSPPPQQNGYRGGAGREGRRGEPR